MFLLPKLHWFTWDLFGDTEYAAKARALKYGSIWYVCGMVVFSVMPFVGMAISCKRTISAAAVQLLVVILMFSMSILFATMTFSLSRLFDSWKSDDFASQPDAVELLAADHFNSRYCGIQSSFLCDHASDSEILSINLTQVVQASVTDANFIALASCRVNYGLNATDPSDMVPAWVKVCVDCATNDPGLNWNGDGFLNWILEGHNFKCRPNSQTVGWCYSSETGTATGSPYLFCRESFLGFAHYWSRTYGGLIVGNILLLVLILGISLQSLAPLIQGQPPQEIHDEPETPTEDSMEVYKISDTLELSTTMSEAGDTPVALTESFLQSR
ncbi:hypothetical protein Poli38472_005872 [Pythium oligandrum]|uniref:Uncharacterized protein n=1 Tax=Pythium oligandrum TaxID=41045 RepID=A0A8K1CSG9_PYTOL|nr:hypothetical protein Poli38472_005872 [Pythium oligandrum]|eukprot:TMW68404.1 hypothetical protein Poli38472_005872 [Pythium oligandrum]